MSCSFNLLTYSRNLDTSLNESLDALHPVAGTLRYYPPVFLVNSVFKMCRPFYKRITQEEQLNSSEDLNESRNERKTGYLICDKELPEETIPNSCEEDGDFDQTKIYQSTRRRIVESNFDEIAECKADDIDSGDRSSKYLVEEIDESDDEELIGEYNLDQERIFRPQVKFGL